MAMATTSGTLSEAEHKRQLTRAIIASTIGTTIEWYDFFLYSGGPGAAAGRGARAAGALTGSDFRAWRQARRSPA